MNKKILIALVLFSVAFMLVSSSMAMANEKQAPEKVMNCGTCYNTYICPEAMKGGEPACNLKYHTFSGWSRLDGPNLILTDSRGIRRTVVITANTLRYPKMLDFKKPHFLYVKYIIDEGLAQAVEVATSFEGLGR